MPTVCTASTPPATLPITANRWGTLAGQDRIAYQPRPDQQGGAPRAAELPGRARDVLPLDARPRAVTFLTASERARFDAATAGVCAPTHCDTVAEIAALLRARSAAGVVVSAGALAAAGASALAGVADLGRAYQSTPLLVLVSGEVAPAVLVALGRSGARAVLDVREGSGAGAPGGRGGPGREAQGWGALQAFWRAAGGRSLAQRAVVGLAEPLAAVRPGMRRFVGALFEVPTRVRTVRGLAPQLGVGPTTLMSRFFRAGLPAPRRYLALARLVRAAQLFESPRWTVGAVAAELELSSAQAFSRHLYLQLGVRPREFRRRYDAEGMIERFGEEVLVPYLGVLREFEPF